MKLPDEFYDAISELMFEPKEGTSKMNIKKFSEHVRECAQCNGVAEVELMCRAGKVLASNISYAGVHSLQGGDAALLTDAIDFIKASEWAGRMLPLDEDGTMQPCCLDCGAEKGQAHSVNCAVASLLRRAGVMP